MAGYSGYSMSNNAVMAYEDGEKPLSKWTKAEIMEGIKKSEIELKCSIEKLQKMPIKLLKEVALSYSSWHHTSNRFNKTDFYSIDEDKLEELTDDKIEKMVFDYKSEKVPGPVEERWRCAFLEWSGTRKHPKATEIVEEGVVKGDWFYRNDGTKKKTTANGFKFIERLEAN